MQDDNNITPKEINIEEHTKKVSKKDKTKNKKQEPAPVSIRDTENEEAEYVKSDANESKFPTNLNSLLLEAGSLKSKEEKLLFCDVINKSKSMFDDISLKVFTQPSPTNANQNFEEEFCAKLEVENASIDSNMLSSLGFIAEYTVKTKDSSTKEYKRLQLKDGVVSFTPPISNVAIDDEIKIYLNPFHDSFLEEDVSLINENIDSDIRERLSATFLHRVATLNRRLSMAIAILDYDQNGKPVLKENIVANRLFVKMMRSGFSRTGLAPFEALASIKDNAIVDHAKTFFKGAVEYYIFGKTYIKNVEKDIEGAWQSQIEATLFIWNLKTDKKLFEFKLEHSAKGKNQWEAIRNARVSLGEEIMFHKILYNF